MMKQPRTKGPYRIILVLRSAGRPQPVQQRSTAASAVLNASEIVHRRRLALKRRPLIHTRGVRDEADKINFVRPMFAPTCGNSDSDAPIAPSWTPAGDPSCS